MSRFSRRRALVSTVALLASLLLAASAQATEFGFLPGPAGFDGFTTNADGTPATQAGSHPYQITTSIGLTTNTKSNPPTPAGSLKDAITELPPGVLGDPLAMPACSVQQLATPDPSADLAGSCPDDTAIGYVYAKFTSGSSDYFALYNLVPPYGSAARFGFTIGSRVPVVFDASLRRGGDYGVTVSARNTTQIEPIVAAGLTIWGVPSDPSHDLYRGHCMKNTWPSLESVGECPATIPPAPYLTLPTACTGPETWSIAVDSWQEPGGFLPDGITPNLAEPVWKTDSFVTHDASGNPIGLDGCNRLAFDPRLGAEPTSNAATSPTGLKFDLKVQDPGLLNPEGIAASDMKKTVVTLPEGFTANPSVAAGLSACSEEAFDAATVEPGTGCPSTSKLGSIEAESPLVAQKLEGSLYIAEPYENPFGSLLALYMVLRNPELGVLIKLPGRVQADPVTGQLTTTFDNLPEVPISRFHLEFREGQRAPLITPAACGTYAIKADLYPFSDPETPLEQESQFQIAQGSGGGPCPSGGLPPFAPELVAGTLDNAAGSYSPMYIQIARKDTEQEITRFSAQLPPGLTANLSGVPFCPDADIALAKTKSGAAEESEPSCPAASRIGRTEVGVGVGTVLAWSQGRLYLAGPYNGAPLSVVAINSAKVGPFDLGTVVVREALSIDPETGVVTVDAKASDPIPHILDGIVIHARDIRVYVDRPDFSINPTSCNPMTFQATADGAGADPSNPADQVPVTVNDRFQAADCASLGFKPSFRVSTSGKTSRKNGANLHVLLTYPNAPQGTQANIKSVHVELPKALPSRLSTLNHACVDSVFNQNPANCPSESRVGFAKAVTPILPVPLEGPAYFVSHGGQKFPELIVVLQGYGVTVDLQGETFISQAGVTSSTFKSVPDVPVGSFELTLPQGPYSALAANRNLCTTSLTMPTKFTGQNGAQLKQTTKIAVTGCKPTLRVVRHNVKGSTVRLIVNTPAAGKLTARGTGLQTVHKNVRKAGNVTVTLTLTKAEQALLRRHHGRRLRTKISLSLAPKHGHKITGSVTVLVG